MEDPRDHAISSGPYLRNLKQFETAKVLPYCSPRDQFLVINRVNRSLNREMLKCYARPDFSFYNKLPVTS